MTDSTLREALPARRPGMVHTIEWAGQPLMITFGWNRQGRIKEIFFTGLKAGSDLDAVLIDAGIALSLALQHGVPIASMAAGMSFASQADPAEKREGVREPISPLGIALCMAAELESSQGPKLAAAAAMAGMPS